MDGMRRNLGLYGMVGVVLGLIILYSILPLGTAVQLSSDEGGELMKASLVHRGFTLYQNIWDDQPPLFTLLINQAFSFGGMSIRSARTMMAVYSILFFILYYTLVKRDKVPVAAIFACWFLVSSPLILVISVAVIQELPTIGFALFSAFIMRIHAPRYRLLFLFASGGLMGLALQVKLTAALMIPSIIIERIFSGPEAHSIVKRKQAKPSEWLRQSSLALSVWFFGALVTWVTISAFCARGSFEAAWQAHVFSKALTGFGDPMSRGFPFIQLLRHFDCVGIAILGLLVSGNSRCWRECLFPSVLLLTVVCVHVVHRPWWDYYYLHLAVPLAWLAGLGACWLMSMAIEKLTQPECQMFSLNRRLAVGFLCILALALARSEKRLEQSVAELRKQERIDANPFISMMKTHAKSTLWCYSEPTIFAFHAGVPSPPELAVISFKRFWSRQIDAKTIAEKCQQYQPEQILLQHQSITAEWKSILMEKYVVGYSNEFGVLFIGKEIGASREK